MVCKQAAGGLQPIPSEEQECLLVFPHSPFHLCNRTVVVFPGDSDENHSDRESLAFSDTVTVGNARLSAPQPPGKSESQGLHSPAVEI